MTQSPALRPAAVIGNGPSLRGFDFKQRLRGYAVFGMNAAYRYWDAIDWYPQYYSCLDLVVGLSHMEGIRRLIERSEHYGMRKFLLRGNLVAALGEWGRHPSVCNFDALREENAFFNSASITTGSHTCAWAAHLGYTDIILLGIDSNYVNHIKESRPVEGAVLEITEDPAENPNYFFTGYQRKGDRYHIPNVHPDPDKAPHLLGWRDIRNALEHSDVIVLNANPDSRMDAFPKAAFDGALDFVNTANALRQKRNAARQDPGLVGVFSRAEGVHCDENAIVRPFLPGTGGVMIDVGAHFGGSCLPFLRQGWSVHAFEPDESNRAELIANVGLLPGLSIDARAASKVSGKKYPWHVSGQSHGISGMLPFDPSHERTGHVTTVTLRDYCLERDIAHVDYLKIGAEGIDYMVLQGFPFERMRPACVVCEFEDKKTLPFLRITLHDMAALLQKAGYEVHVSEWHPILHYGIPHQWRRFVPYPTATASPAAWGNLVAFAEKTDPVKLRNAVAAAIRPGAAKVPPDSGGMR